MALMNMEKRSGEESEAAVSAERINTAIDLLTAMAVEELANETSRSPSEVLPEFLASRTAKMLYEEESKLWWDGPSAVAEMYKNELMKQNCEKTKRTEKNEETEETEKTEKTGSRSV